MTSFGNINNNLTLGIGYGFSGDEFFDTPVFQVGGMVRVSNSVMLVADNFVVDSGNSTVSGGTLTIRYITNKIGIDLGLVTDYDEGAFPIVGVAIRF